MGYLMLKFDSLNCNHNYLYFQHSFEFKIMAQVISLTIFYSKAEKQSLTYYLCIITVVEYKCEVKGKQPL